MQTFQSTKLKSNAKSYLRVFFHVENSNKREKTCVFDDMANTSYANIIKCVQLKISEEKIKINV